MFKNLLVTAESPGTFAAACDFSDMLLHYLHPEEVNFLFIDDDLSAFNENLKVRVRDCMDQYMKQGVNVDLIFKHGSFQKGTMDCAVSHHTDLVICGAELVTGFRRFWNGSKTYRFIKSSPSFVISLQKAIPRREIKKIILPIDSSTETWQKVPAAYQMARLFHASVVVVGVSTGRGNDNYGNVTSNVERSVNYLQEKGTQVSQQIIEGSNLTDMTLYVAEKQAGDLILMMAVEEANPYGMIEGSYPEQMILKSMIPVMAIRPRHELGVDYEAM